MQQGEVQVELSLFRVFVVSYLKDESLPTFIGSSSGVSKEILHVAFPHVFGHVFPCSFCYFFKMSGLL